VQLREMIARTYGLCTPMHSGKWRVIHALLPARRTSAWRTLQLDGFRISVDTSTVMGEHLYFGRAHEYWETRQVRQHVKAGDVALDVGAHIGYYSLLLSRLVGSNGRVYAFEPSSRNWPVLEDNLKQNGIRNVDLVPAALSDHTRTANLGGTTLDTLRISTKYDGEKIRLITLDSWAESIGLRRLDFIKADVEGHEIPFLHGGERTIRHFRPILLLEACASNQRDSGFTLEKLRQTIIDLGYQVYRIHRRRLVPWLGDPGEFSFGAWAITQS
jgi:FkbM family methyltransferase